MPQCRRAAMNADTTIRRPFHHTMLHPQRSACGVERNSIPTEGIRVLPEMNWRIRRTQSREFAKHLELVIAAEQYVHTRPNGKIRYLQVARHVIGAVLRLPCLPIHEP